MRVPIDRRSNVPVYLQISHGIREKILSGDIPEGSKLPPDRILADDLGVNRSTIVNAYRDLKTGGLVDAHVGRGTTVLRRRSPSAGRLETRPLSWSQVGREGTAKVDDPLLRDLLELSERSDVISFAVGLPAPDLLPIAAVRKHAMSLIDELGPLALLHSPTEGLTRLRESIGEVMRQRGVACSPAQVLVLSGSQQGLDLAARVLIEPGDEVVVEEPSFFGALQVFREARAHLLGVPTDRDGMRTDRLEALLSHHRPKLIYTLPTFQNPSGVTMSLERRHHLLELARRFEIPILEDDPYGDIRYEGTPLPPLKALDPDGYVLYLSSFSKVLFPGLRVGWLVAAPQAHHRFVLAKQTVDLHSGTLGQQLLDRIVRSGLYARHLKTIRTEYASRRDLMYKHLLSDVSSEFVCTKPDGGFYIWCRFPAALSHARLLPQMARRKVGYLPGNVCFVDEPAENYMRLNFTCATPERIRIGIGRLTEAIRAAASEPRPRNRVTAETRPIV